LLIYNQEDSLGCLGLPLLLLLSFAIGANDVANSFASALSSGLMSMRTVVIIASFTEFFGAVAMGGRVTSTIRGKIVDVNLFEDRQDLLMFGMFLALLGSGCWDLTATYFKMPVSTTHSIVGGVVGIGVATFGMKGVNWGWDSGVARIVFGFIMSPILAGCVAAFLFTLTRLAVLERENSFQKALISTPIYAFCTTLIIMIFFVYKGSPRLGLQSYPTSIKMAIIFPPAIVVTLLSIVVFIPFIKRYTAKKAEKFQEMVDEAAEDDEKEVIEEIESPKEMTLPQRIRFRLNRTLFYGFHQKFDGAQTEHQTELHSHAKEYDKDTEVVFMWLQCLSCSAASFAHGANDVANAIAPLSTVFAIWEKGSTGPSSGKFSFLSTLSSLSSLFSLLSLLLFLPQNINIHYHF
jgi:solute carrier family 20 (sodium-dependent phosphate transporter)